MACSPLSINFASIILSFGVFFARNSNCASVQAKTSFSFSVALCVWMFSWGVYFESIFSSRWKATMRTFVLFILRGTTLTVPLVRPYAQGTITTKATYTLILANASLMLVSRFLTGDACVSTLQMSHFNRFPPPGWRTLTTFSGLLSACSPWTPRVCLANNNRPCSGLLAHYRLSRGLVWICRRPYGPLSFSRHPYWP